MRNSCAPQRRLRDVTRTSAGVTDETLSRKSPSCKKAQVLSARTWYPWRHTNTFRNHGYNAPAAMFCAASGTRSRERGKKSRKGQEFRVHTYPTVSSRPRGRCVQSVVQIGSEMWICIRYKQTNFYLYIKD